MDFKRIFRKVHQSVRIGSKHRVEMDSNGLWLKTYGIYIKMNGEITVQFETVESQPSIEEVLKRHPKYARGRYSDYLFDLN